jgi:hypothetical protein
MRRSVMYEDTDELLVIISVSMYYIYARFAHVRMSQEHADVM